jgi:hypothetical protein
VPALPATGACHTTPTPIAPALSRRDAHVAALTRAGGAYPAFDDRSEVADDYLLNLVQRSSHRAFDYLAYSDAVIEHVRSGKMTLPALGLRRRADEQDEVDLPTPTITVNTVLAPLRVAELRSFGQLGGIFASLIVPALFNRPRALADWCSLMTSVSEIDSREGWAAASYYLNAHLSMSVRMRESFGVVNQNIASSALLQHQLSRNTQRNGASAYASSTGGGSAHTAPFQTGYACKRWNSANCPLSDEACIHLHRCLNAPQCNGPVGHRIAECPARDKGASASSSHSARSNGGPPSDGKGNGRGGYKGANPRPNSWAAYERSQGGAPAAAGKGQ